MKVRECRGKASKGSSSIRAPVILPIPDPDWAVEINKFYPGEIDRDLVPSRAPAFVSGKAGQKRESSFPSRRDPVSLY